jgi:hypothetical protein
MRRVSYPARLLYTRLSRRVFFPRAPQRPCSQVEDSYFDDLRDELRRDECERSEAYSRGSS